MVEHYYMSGAQPSYDLGLEPTPELGGGSFAEGGQQTPDSGHSHCL